MMQPFVVGTAGMTVGSHYCYMQDNGTALVLEVVAELEDLYDVGRYFHNIGRHLQDTYGPYTFIAAPVEGDGKGKSKSKGKGKSKGGEAAAKGTAMKGGDAEPKGKGKVLCKGGESEPKGEPKGIGKGNLMIDKNDSESGSAGKGGKADGTFQPFTPQSSPPQTPSGIPMTPCGPPPATPMPPCPGCNARDYARLHAEHPIANGDAIDSKPSTAQSLVI